jgi:hypothetical protein
MMKTKYFFLTLLMALSSMTFTACSDDDETTAGGENPEVVDGDAAVADENGDTNKTTQNVQDADETHVNTQERLLLTQQHAIISILSQLAGVDSVPARFDLEKYEPVYGIVLDESNPYVRSVQCDSAKTAEQMFRDLVGQDELLTTTADGLSVTLKDMPLMTDGTLLTLGTLTFHRGDGQSELGSVDIRISCMPHLIRLDYLPKEAFPMNDASNSPYKVGDVVWVNRGGKYCSGYYLCVKQEDTADGILVHLCEGEAKDDETINLDGDNDGCWYPYNNRLGESYKTTPNDVKAYLRFLRDEKAKAEAVRQFLDGKSTKKKPAHSGKKHHIFPSGFDTEENYIYKSSNGKHARIFYAARYGSYAWIPAYYYRIAQYVYVSNYDQTMQYVDTYELEYVNDSWWNSHVNDKNNFTMNVIHFSSEVPNATKELSVQDDILEFENNAKYAKQSHVGWIYGQDNRLYPNVARALKAGTKPLGIVAYVNEGTDFGNKATEAAAGYGHGLVLSHMLGSSGNWVRWNGTEKDIVSLSKTTGYTQFIPNTSTASTIALNDFDGIKKTTYLKRQGSPAAISALSMMTDEQKSRLHSDWFLPSTGQWIAILSKPGVGGTERPKENDWFPTRFETGTSKAYDNIQSILSGDKQYWSYYSMRTSHEYWSSSAYSGRFGIYLLYEGDKYGETGTRLGLWRNVYTYCLVRPVFAF